MLATIGSSIVQGVDGLPVSVEVHVSNGLPGYTLVGLPDASCRESRDRVRAAILSSGADWPNRRITINLAPSGLRKQGSALDLPIALGILGASKQINAESLRDVGAVGELGLDGRVRPVPGLISLADAVDTGELYVARRGAEQAAVVRRGAVRGVGSLQELVEGLQNKRPLPPVVLPGAAEHGPAELGGDLADVRGQPLARWALEVAAAGGHHLLMVGPPGAGKTMLANRLVGLLPELSPAESLAATRVHSAAGLAVPQSGLLRRPPYRAPHHGASMVAMIGGGTAAMRPGEISCAHNGVLFLDELGEHQVPVLDALRQPLEQGVVRVCRAVRSIELPARFLLVAAMNPCPCGEGGAAGGCRCSDAARARYARRLSGPLLDRFDIRIEVRPPEPELLLTGARQESSADVAERVAAARQRAVARGASVNAALSAAQLEQQTQLSDSAEAVLRAELRGGRLTGRGLRRVRAVALTIADLRSVACGSGREVAAPGGNGGPEAANPAGSGSDGSMTGRTDSQGAAPTTLTADDVQAALALRSSLNSVLGVAA